MVSFRFWHLRLLFVAHARVQFPAAFSANVFRGALGTRLPPEIFAPALIGPGPSGLRQMPRPFVLRARQLDGLAFESGQTFLLDLHLFAPVATQIMQAFGEAQPFHGALQLADSFQLSEISLSLSPGATECHSVQIRFVPPTELKHNGEPVSKPEFPILFARALARLRTLSVFYGAELMIDSDALAGQAASIALMKSSLTREYARRFSTRTGQTHPLEGFTGAALYEGQLRQVLPFLVAAQYTGVGRQTVWGKGEIEVSSPLVQLCESR